MVHNKQFAAVLHRQRDVSAIDPCDAIVKRPENELRIACASLPTKLDELTETKDQLRSLSDELQVCRDEQVALREELRVVNTTLDHTRRELEQTRTDLQNLFADADHAILFLDHELRITRFTPAARVVLRLIDADVGRPLSQLAPALAGRDLAADAAEVLRTRHPIEREVETLDRSAWLLLRVRPCCAVPDGLPGAVIALTDITQLKHAHAELLATVSHELRNPLTPISCGLEVLESAKPGGELARRAVAVIQRQFGQISRMIEALLDATRVTHGKIQLRRERLDLGDLVRRTVEDYRDTFGAAGIALELMAASGAMFVDGDPTRLSQVLGNLLQNATKFTPRGGAAVVSVVEDAASTRALIRVQDTGHGIDPVTLPRVFEPFVQAEATLDHDQRGLGLGLAVVKGVIEAHGGMATVASAGRGQGATFTLSLPLAGP